MMTADKSRWKGGDFIIRILAFLLVLFSTAEFLVGGATYGFLTNVHLGSWWAAICPFIAGVLGCFPMYRFALKASCVVAMMGLITAVVGAVIDCVATSVIGGETGCVNTETNHSWGSNKGIYYASECAIDYILSHNQDDPSDDVNILSYHTYNGTNTDNYWYGRNLYFYNHPYNYYYNHPYNSPYRNQTHPTAYYYFHNHQALEDDCYTYSGTNFYYNHPYYFMNHYGFYQPYQCVCSDDRVCYGYNLAMGQNCGAIMTTYVSMLITSTSLLSALCVVSFAFVVLSGISVYRSSGMSGAVAAATYPEVQLTPKPQPQLQYRPYEAGSSGGGGDAPLYVVAPIQVQEGPGSAIPPGATVVMMVRPNNNNNNNGGIGSGGAAAGAGGSVRHGRRPSSQLPTVLED